MGRVDNRVKSHKEAREYIQELQKGAPDSKREAREALIRTGVLTKSGKRKEVIVSWE